MDFLHTLLKPFVPSEIYISKEKLIKKSQKCSQCQENYKKYTQKYHLYKIDTDIFFDVYYWIRTDALDNKYAYDDTINELCLIFDCKPDSLLDYAKQIGIQDMVALGTYHSVWNHYYMHEMYSSPSGWMEKWDCIVQRKHVCMKNLINLLIYLLLTDPERKNHMTEIRAFTFVPPVRPGAICGYEYQQAKQNFEKYK